MTSTGTKGVFARIDSRVLELSCGPRTSPVESRNALYGPRRDAEAGAAVLREAVRAAQGERGDSDGRLFVVWLLLPGCYRTLHRLCRQWPVDRADLEAEAVLAVLEAVDAADPDDPATGALLVKGAVNRMWAYAKRVAAEIPVADVGAIAEARNRVDPQEELPSSYEEWDLHVMPPPRREGLKATLRFAEPRSRQRGGRDGIRLADVVFRARRHEEADLVGTLALRPTGADR
ncbi:hypothetical protein [Streptomyces sp. CA2R106]|uniref:hypothetical protein n=1 Tax=Streptomyces sp. CA2R106 TaxID=3120153 RepID=UPI00300927DD